MGKTDVYSLGERGVNVTKSPIHLEDGELTQAQNAAFNPEQAEGGLSKRGGMPRLNSSALDGAVKGLFGVPLPDPDDAVASIWAAQSTIADASTWSSSPTGATWTPGTTLSEALSIAKLPFAAYEMQRAAYIGNRIYYPGNTYTQYNGAGHQPPYLLCYDGTTEYRVFTVPYPPKSGSTTNAKAILDIIVHEGSLYFTVWDDVTERAGRVFRYNLTTGVFSQVGNSFGTGTGETGAAGMPFCLCSFGGRLWAGTYNVAGGAVGRIYHIEPNTETTWTLDFTSATSQGYIMSMASYKGRLFAGTMADVGFAALIKVRENGAWTTARTAATTTASNVWGPLFVFDDKLFAVWVDYVAATKAATIDEYDNTTWSQSLDIDAAVGAANVRRAGQALVTGTAAFVAFAGGGDGADENGFIYKYDGSSWSQVLTAEDLRGYLVRLVVP